MNPFATAIAAAAGTLRAVTGDTVTYRRGGSSVQVVATVGKTTRDVDESDGLVTRYESRDFLVTAAELVLGGVRVMPLPGDQVVEGDGTVCELMDFPGEGYWRWSDPYRVTLRIHTKRVSA